MSTELNNYLLDADNREREDYVAESKSEIKDKALLALGLLVGAGAAMGGAGKANADELLLCTYNDPDVGNLAGTIVDDPTGSQDQLFQPDPWTSLQLDEAVSQKVYKGYVLKNMTEYVEGGTNNWRIFKKINGQDVQVGVLDGMEGQPIALMTDSGVFFSGGKFYKVTDTGTTLSSQEIGELPLPGMAGMADMGGYIFANYTDGGKEMLAAFNEQEVLDHAPGSGLIPIASLRDITPPKITSQWSLGMNVDESTNELIIPQKQGVTPIDFTAFLDEDGQLPPDFSLTDVEVGTFKDLGVSTVGTMASNGYKYHGIAGGAGIIMQTPDGQTITIGKEQLNGGAGIKLSTMYELVHGGIYIIFNNDFDDPSPVPPVVLHEDGSITVDPGDMTAFIKKCFVIQEEDQDMFAPVVDPCADVTCPPPAEQCKTAVCDQATGDCVDANKIDGTTCDADANACTVGDSCADGQCAPGAPKTCPQPAEQCKQSAGCDANTGNCLITNKTNGVSCNDENPDTENDQCASGVCEGTPVVKPEPDGDDAEQEDVIEGELVEEVEPDEDVVEAYPEGGDSDVVNPDTIEPDMTSPEPDADVAGQEIEQETDTSADNTTPPEVEEDQGGDETEGEAQEGEVQGEETEGEEIQEGDALPKDDSTPVIEEETPGKTPGCSCDVSDTQRQQRGIKEMLLMFGLAALTVLGLRRKEGSKESRID